MQAVSVDYISSDGLRLKGDHYGDPANPPLIFLHGGGQTRHSWGEAAVKVAEAGWHVINMDSRGHGESDWCPRSDYEVETFVGDLKTVLATLKEKPVVVGASKGGIIALATACMDQSLLRGIVLVDVTPRLEPEGVGRILEFMRSRADGFASLEEAADTIASYTRRERPKNLEGLRKNLRETEDGRFIWHWDPQLIDGDFQANIQRRCLGLLDEAVKVSIPTLLVRGAQSDVVSHEGVQEFRKAVRHAEYVDVEEASHMVAGDQNTVFAHAVIDFIARL